MNAQIIRYFQDIQAGKGSPIIEIHSPDPELDITTDLQDSDKPDLAENKKAAPLGSGRLFENPEIPNGGNTSVLRAIMS